MASWFMDGLQYILGVDHPKNENAAIIYSPSCLTNLHDLSSTEHKINIFWIFIYNFFFVHTMKANGIRHMFFHVHL